MIKRRKIIITFIICSILGLSGPLSAAKKNQPAEVQGKPVADESGQQEVVIRGVHRLKVKVEKPDPDISFDGTNTDRPVLTEL